MLDESSLADPCNSPLHNTTNTSPMCARQSKQTLMWPNILPESIRPANVKNLYHTCRHFRTKDVKTPVKRRVRRQTGLDIRGPCCLRDTKQGFGAFRKHTQSSRYGHTVSNARAWNPSWIALTAARWKRPPCDRPKCRHPFGAGAGSVQGQQSGQSEGGRHRPQLGCRERFTQCSSRASLLKRNNHRQAAVFFDESLELSVFPLKFDVDCGA